MSLDRYVHLVNVLGVVIIWQWSQNPNSCKEEGLEVGSFQLVGIE